jgi:predicted Co/Zn/Cd cation transporter (cation efflux family)
MSYLQDLIVSNLTLVIILLIWDVIWKVAAMWKAGRDNQLVWFISIAFLNTLGILPAIYIFTQRKKNRQKEKLNN